MKTISLPNLIRYTVALLLWCPATLSSEEYGEIVVYDNMDLVAYQDISIRYVGILDLTYPEHSERKFPEQFFEISSSKTSNRIFVSWGAGMGEVSPTFFAFEGNRYLLELISSQKVPLEKSTIPEGSYRLWKIKN